MHTDDNAKEARQLLLRLEKIAPNDAIRHRARQVRARLLLPMELVLRRVPGKSIADKAKTLGVGRQRVHFWMNETTRPNIKMAKKLALITGYDFAAIRGVSGD